MMISVDFPSISDNHSHHRNLKTLVLTWIIFSLQSNIYVMNIMINSLILNSLSIVIHYKKPKMYSILYYFHFIEFKTVNAAIILGVGVLNFCKSCGGLKP
jgi:hypothetical protein